MRKFMLLGILTILFPFALSAQNIKVSGKVLDASTNEALVGVTVVQTGTQNGTITDLDGNFTLDNVASDASLSFSYIGYVTETIFVNGKSTIVCNLKTDDKELEEIVVVGYGTQKKSDLTGAVASINEDALKNRSTTDAAAALQGKASGVQVLNNSGAPGEGAKIRVRGYSSNAGEIGPLLIVDGLKVDNIQYLDPSMIESMEVLKDAASAAIYGAQAGNGVILITTKNGGKGTSSITYEGKFTLQSLGKKAEIFEADEYIEYNKATGKLTDGILNTNGYKPGDNYDWFDAVFENSWAKQHSITFQGGNKEGHYLASINYVNNDGIVKSNKDTYERLTAQFNADYNIKSWLNISSNNSIEKWSRKSVSSAAYGSFFNSVLSLDPLTPAYYSSADELPNSQKSQVDIAPRDPNHNNDYYAASKYFEEATGNPLYQRDKSDSKQGGFNLRGITSLNFKPIKSIVFTSRLGYTIAQDNTHTYTPPSYMSSLAKQDQYSIEAKANTKWSYQFENFLNFNKTFAEKHNVGVMVGMSYEEQRNDNVNIKAEDNNLLTNYSENFQYIDYVKSSVKKNGNNKPEKNANMSYFGRISYSYDNKYNLQFNYRADAYDSSKLPKDVRWGKFPSLSAGWTISRESFIKDNITNDALSFLKIRASWGRNGNVNILNGYKYIPTVSVNSDWYYMGNNTNLQYGSALSGLANPDLTWETAEQIDLGLDARFLSDRLSLGVDWYKKTTKDMLLQVAPLSEIGIKNTYVNAGEVLNQGIEFELGWKSKIGELSYSINGNISTLKNEVTDMPKELSFYKGSQFSGLNNTIAPAMKEKESLWYFYGYKYAYPNPKDGTPMYYNINGEVVDKATVTEADQQYIGSPLPKGTYGLTLNLEYKGIDFMVFGTGVWGNDIVSLLYSADRPLSNCLKLYYEDSWTPENKGAKYAEVSSVATDWIYWSSSASVFNGAYFKFKQIQLGYTLPSNITKKAFISNCRVYVSLDDYFTITKYPGCDPETATTTNAQQMGFDAGTYPTTKKVIFGVRVTF